MDKSRKYEFMYENRWTGLAFVVISFFLFAALYALIDKMFDLGWVLSIFGLMLLLPWVIIYYVAQIDTFNAYAYVNEEGIEIHSKFKEYFIEWDKIENIFFVPYSTGFSKSRGLHINIKNNWKSIHFIVSRRDKKRESLYSFYELIRDDFNAFKTKESIDNLSK